MANDERGLIPLRMVVQWAYCPRLFHYMEVEGLSVANEHVWKGRHAHARSDKAGTSRSRRKDLPEADAPAEEPEDERPPAWRESRAVELGSTALGLVAKLDGVLFDEAGRAIPTELKSGSAPAEDSDWCHFAPGAWDSDAVHVALQAMLLEADGKTVPRAELWYRGSRTRVEVALTEPLRRAALDALEGAQRARTATVRPPPLEESPKCNGCSFATVCMPDESRLLREGIPADDGLEDEAAPVIPARALKRRRLVASAVEGRSVVVSTPGASVRKDGPSLVISPPPGAEGKPVRVALESVEDLCLFGNVHASTATVAALLEEGVAVSFHTGTGRLLGTVSTGLANNVRLRVAQHEAAADPSRSLGIAREFVRGKLRNQRVLLRRNGGADEHTLSDFDASLRALDAAQDADTLRGVEGTAAVEYFERFGALLADRGGEAFRMDGRTRRPPQDPSNAMLSFGYAVLSRMVSEVLRRVGFDPMRGLLHGMGWGRPALALDLMEEFRALLVDSTVLRVVAERRVTPGDFQREMQGITMRPTARRVLLQALDQRREEEVTHPVFGYKVSYRRAIELQARVLARVLEGEAERYIALTTR